MAATLLMAALPALVPSFTRLVVAPRSAAPLMQFGQKLPPEVSGVLKPAYKGAARGGQPFVAGTEKELTDIWKAMVRVYGGRDDALTAVRRNQQVILPYINTAETIVGAHAALVGIFGKEGAARIIRKNPGVLACNPKTLAETPAADIEKAADFVLWFDGLPPVLKEGIPFFTFLGIVGVIGARVIACGGGACGTAAEWDLKGGLGVQLKDAVVGLISSAVGS